MAKAKPQGKKPPKAPPQSPDSSTRQSNQGTGKDNRKPPTGNKPNPTGQNWGGHLQGN